MRDEFPDSDVNILSLGTTFMNRLDSLDDIISSNGVYVYAMQSPPHCSLIERIFQRMPFQDLTRVD